jgi:peptidoglycan/LPS O-acetylase OafA/YrhL
MLFAMLMYWHDLRWYGIGVMLRYLANSDGARPWMVMHLCSLCVEEQFYFAWPGVLRKWYRHRVALLWESSRLLLSIALVVIISKFKVEAMEHFPQSLTISQSAACWRYSVRVSRKSGSGRRFPWCWRFFSFRAIPRILRSARYLCCCAVADLALLDCRTGVARHPVAVSYLEPCSRRVAGENQLQPVSGAGTLFFNPTRQPVYKLLLGIGLACLSY